jgi:pimeloyl-ACP methyl ester carboxylesterase
VVLAQLAAGETQVLEVLLDELTPAPQTDVDSLASGTYGVVMCADDGPESPADLALREDPGPWSDLVLAEAAFCDVWNVHEERDARMEHASSDHPVLAFTGEFDPWAPLEFAEEILAAHPHATSVVVPGSGHGVAFANECTTAITLSFTSSPATAPDLTCVEDLPALFLPEE